MSEGAATLSHMPSQDLEDLVRLFMEWPGLSVDLLGWCGVEPPAFTEARNEQGHVLEAGAPGYHADVVTVLRDQGRAVLVVVIEVQLSPDARKRYRWPLYQAGLANHFECPVELLVVSLEGATPTWVHRVIGLMREDQRVPLSLVDAEVPEITDLDEAKRSPVRAIFSAVWHGKRAPSARGRRESPTRPCRHPWGSRASRGLYIRD